MKCPSCPCEAWALYICDDGRYRCWQCRATGKGRIVVHRPVGHKPVVRKGRGK